MTGFVVLYIYRTLPHDLVMFVLNDRSLLSSLTGLYSLRPRDSGPSRPTICRPPSRYGLSALQVADIPRIQDLLTTTADLVRSPPELPNLCDRSDLLVGEARRSGLPYPCGTSSSSLIPWVKCRRDQGRCGSHDAVGVDTRDGYCIARALRSNTASWLTRY
jgi:hypothetical protein